MRSFAIYVYLLVAAFAIFSSGDNLMETDGPENLSNIKQSIKEVNENFYKIINETWEEIAEYEKALQTLPNFSGLADESKGLGEEAVKRWSERTEKCICDKGFPGVIGRGGERGDHGPKGAKGEKGLPGTINHNGTLC